MKYSFPSLDPVGISSTVGAVHAYSQLLGDWLGSGLARRKHWWQLAVQPSIGGLSTGLVRMGIDFELELDLERDCLRGRVANGGSFSEHLGGRPPGELAEIIQGFLIHQGIDQSLIPADKGRKTDSLNTPAYSVETARALGAAIRSVNAAMTTFRAGIAEETSPIQIWPHHFDLAMMWLPGMKIPGQDPEDEENSDVQMNFGFTFGDDFIPEPYFYISAYPLPDTLPGLSLPDGTKWQSEGFSGAVLPYSSLLTNDNPDDYLLDLWSRLLTAGRKDFFNQSARGDLI